MPNEADLRKGPYEDLCFLFKNQAEACSKSNSSMCSFIMLYCVNSNAADCVGWL